MTQWKCLDMPKALSKEEIAQALELSSITKQWHIEATCATTGQGMHLFSEILSLHQLNFVALGLYEGLDWLVDQINV